MRLEIVFFVFLFSLFVVLITVGLKKEYSVTDGV